MDDDERTQQEDEDKKLEARMLAVVMKCIPAARTARNATKILRRLSSATTDTVVAALEAKSSDFRLRTERNEYVIAQLAQLPRGQAHIGVKIAERLVNKQHRLDQVVFAAIRHVVDSEETSSNEGGTDELDDDWIEGFREKPCSEVKARCERRSHVSWRGRFGNREHSQFEPYGQSAG